MSGVTTRHARALTLASASFGLGLLGHLQAGGHATSATGLTFAAGWCAVSGWSASRHRASAPGLGGLLIANQVVMHLALAVSSATVTLTSTAEDCAHDVSAVAATTGHSGHAGMALLPSGWMLLAHLLATAMAAGAILAVEAAALGLLMVSRWLDRVVAVAARPPLALHRCGLPVATALLPAWASHHPGAVPARGPPLHIAR